ncbi:MAG TPA: 2OG-Fe(II) oxygenase [Bryobacteraceae bacterium]|nr:2OG-Fe(II) oxygenase [Bryobacteraceae bacterium]
MASPNVASRALAPIPQISEAALREADGYREVFLHADPFKHVLIENFFAPEFAERLLADFPSFDTRLAKNEMGQLGGKAVQMNIRTISPVYEELYAVIGGRPFLEFVSRLAGIPDLILDPKMYGGGTHDNQHGQELDPHVDFNYDEGRQLHRRLNLIVYMNKEWRTEWGGALEIHSNPRLPDENRIRAFDPLFNRCVMFETNEYSWHGFPKIDLPADKRHLSRKSISIYLYTKARPAEEIAPMHGTFYVQRPLPQSIAAGHTLSDADVDALRRLLTRRDGWIEAYQRLELEKNRELADRASNIQELTGRIRAPLTGYILQEGMATGLYADGWVAQQVEVNVRALLPVSEIILRGWRRDNLPRGRVRVSIGDAASVETETGAGMFEVRVKLQQSMHDTFRILVVFTSDQKSPSLDGRDLAFVLTEIRARHFGYPVP